MEAFDKLVKDNTQFLDNEYVSGALLVFLIVYSSAIAPKLPNYMIRMFDYTAVKLLFFFMILLVSKKSPTIALIGAVALMVSIITLNRLKFDQEMMSVVNNEERSSRQILLETCSCTCDCLNDIIPITNDGKLVVEEIKNAVVNGALPPAKGEELAKQIVASENNGLPVLVAQTEEGLKRMEEIQKSLDSGKINEEVAKKMESVIVVAEAVLQAKAETKAEVSQTPRGEVINRTTPKVEEVSSASSSPSMAEMAEEVLRRKQEETNRRGGVPMSGEELKNLCAGVIDDYKRTNTKVGCKDCDSVSSESSVVSSDPMSTSYASVSQ